MEKKMVARQEKKCLFAAVVQTFGHDRDYIQIQCSKGFSQKMVDLREHKFKVFV